MSIFDVDNLITDEWLIQNGWEPRTCLGTKLYILKLKVQQFVFPHRIEIWFHYSPTLKEVGFTNRDDAPLIKVETTVDIMTYVEHNLKTYNYELVRL